jgi:ribonuclease PH
MVRADGRPDDQCRPVKITLGFMPQAEGSALIELGDTRVICTVSVENRVPPFLVGHGQGWLTAEYRMLPRSTNVRTPRDSGGRVDGRSTEIQRLIGRSLRAAVDRTRLGERTLTVDCDVLNADGGTRTAAITGAWIAVVLACARLRAQGQINAPPVCRQVAAISAGIVQGRPLLDLAYGEDSIADVDCNAVLTERAETVEFQLSSERVLARPEQVDVLRSLTRLGVDAMLRIQREVLDAVDPTLLDLTVLTDS